MIYARATPGFHLRHLTEIVANPASSTEHHHSPSEVKQNLSLSSGSKSLIRRTTPYRDTLFSEELREIYTGERDHPDSHTPYLDFENVQEADWRTTRLREDLLFMWRTRLYSDVQIEIPRIRQKQPGDVVFPAHRFILHSRSPYFARILSKASGDDSIINPTPDHPLTITFRSPPFTAFSFDYILEFIYTGTLKIMNDELKTLNTALSIWRGSLYFELPSLRKLIYGHITQNLLHGLCYSTLDEKEYQKIVGNSWTAMVRLGGCQCQRCKIWAPRLLEFSMDPSIKDDKLERGSLRALVKLFGPGWCTIQFASLPQNLLDYLILVVRMTILTPKNALCLLFAAEEALNEMNKSHRPWISPVKAAVTTVRNLIDAMFCEETAECLKCEDWEKIREDDALGLMSNVKKTENTLKLSIIRDAIFRAVGESNNAGKIYNVRQTVFQF